ncbi:hypothetical protein HAX54_022965 [Datura stramonium]|uniref:F-box domain-containing protein n=1 Tax=Datura stramonium TaxID=4076 RepID=A0ABS8UWJ4_DATST|nr:hypothetical protein [Datura stramonium]
MKVYERRRRKKKSASVVTNNPDLPKAMIEEILSCLPVKSLLRFKCVSKYWNSITLDPQFISLHSENSPLITYNKSEDDEFVVLDQYRGLLLEQIIVDSSSSSSTPYRIRNPETRQIIQLPNAQKNPSLHMYLAFLPSKQAFKVLSLYEEDNHRDLGCEILDLGNENNTNSWRFLKLPTLQNAGEKMITEFRVLVISQVAYCIWEWNETASFGKIVNDELHVLVLDDYKSNKWKEEKRIVKMKNLKEEEDEPIKLICVLDSDLYFLLQDKKSFCKYNFSTRKVETLMSDFDESKVSAVIQSSLYSFKGMEYS